MIADQELDALLNRLHLANTRRTWRELARRAEQEDWTYHDFFVLLVTEEIAHRQQTRLERVVRRARFPFLKTIDDFNFMFQSTVRLSLLGSALAPDFVTEGRCLILCGKPGRGKTHLAVAIAYRAIQNGFDALFATAAELIDELSAAFRKGRLAEALTRYTHPDLLVVDEVGYLTYGTDAANMLFHVVNDRHKRKRSMVFTTNKPLAAWGSVLHDDDLAQAIVDRVLERGRLLRLDGPSMRTKHLGLDDPTAAEAPSTQVVRISGISSSEFPEPTLSSSAKSTEVHAGIRKSPPVWTRSGQSFGEPLRTGDLRLGNEPVRYARTFRMFPESARPCDFIRICRQHRKAQPVPRRLTVSAGAARLPARTDVDERGPTGGCTEVIRSCTAPGARLRASSSRPSFIHIS